MLAGIALYLRLHRVPGVYGPLALAAEIAVWLFVLALAVWYGSRRNEPLRKPAIAMLLAWEWTVALTGLSRPSLAAGINIPDLALQIIPTLLILSATVYALRASKWPRLPPNQHPTSAERAASFITTPTTPCCSCNGARASASRSTSPTAGAGQSSAARWLWSPP